ncbi:hypothetical protein DFJ77DRAFT_551023 [Powellomyces hirtus]|nr:hypothetical protein DFJ77DRAFT_551023 [Powellomyces hirtus]
MTTSVRIQEPYPLTAHPFSVALPKRVSFEKGAATTSVVTPSGSKKKGKKAVAAATTSSASREVAPTGFLTAAVPEYAYGELEGADHVAEVVTVQGSAVYLYDLQRQQCLHSWSVPPGHLFSCPARYLPAAPSNSDDNTNTNPPVTNGNVVEDNEDADIPIATRLAGNVYAVIDAGADIQEKNEKKTIWMWKVVDDGQRDDAEKQTLAAGKPDAAQTFTAPIQHLATFVPSKTAAHAYVTLIHSEGTVTVASRDLKPVAEWSSPAAATPAQVVWSTTFDVVDEEQEVEWRSQRIVSVLVQSNVYTVRVASLTVKPTGAVSIDLVSEVELPACGPAYPVAFTAQQRGTKLVVAYSNSDVKVHDVSSNAIAKEQIAFSLRMYNFALPPNSTAASGPAPLAMYPIDTNYVAIVGSSRKNMNSTKNTNPTDVDELLTIWDIKYGALHFEKVLNGTDSGESAETSTTAAAFAVARTYQTILSVSPLTGPVITISTSRVAARSPVTFSSTVDLIPFHCPPLTLASVLGKLRKPLLAAALDTSSSSSLSASSSQSTSTSAHPSASVILGSVLDNNAVKPIGLGMATVGPVAAPVVDADNNNQSGDINALAEWNAKLHDLDTLDQSYVLNLLRPSLTADAFSTLFCEWMQKKLAEERRLQLDRQLAIAEEKTRLEKEMEAKRVVRAKPRHKALKAKAEASDSDMAVDPANEAPAPKYLTLPPTPHLLNNLPKVILSPTALHPLLSHCMRAPKLFWPRHAIQYMLRSGAASSKFCAALFSDNNSNNKNNNKPTSSFTSNGIISKALERPDMGIMELALRWVTDLGEDEIVDAIKWVCEEDNAPRTTMLTTWCDLTHRKREKHRREKAVVMNKDRLKNLAADKDTETLVTLQEPLAEDVDLAQLAHEIETKTVVKIEPIPIYTPDAVPTTTAITTPPTTKSKSKTPGRDMFLRAIFNRPRTDNFLVYALKKLSARELTVVVEWLYAILVCTDEQADGDGRKHPQENGIVTPAAVSESESESHLPPATRPPLWWVWEQPRNEERIEEHSLEEWNLALDILPLLLTSHLPTILHTRALTALLTRIHISVTTQTQLFTLLQTRLRAPLLVMETEKQRYKQEKQNKHNNNSSTVDEDGNDRNKGRRWKRMLENVAGPRYEVEVYRL